MHAARSLARTALRSNIRPTKLNVRALHTPVNPRLWRPATSTFSQSSSFSTSIPRFEGGNEELRGKLEQELAYEKDVLAEQQENTTIKEYLGSSPYQIEDVDGSEEVHLVRTYGDEQIKVTFSTESLSNPETDADAATDPALYDEDAEGRGVANQSGPEGGRLKQVPEDEVDEEYNAEPSNFQVQVNVQVSRQGKGAIVLACYLDQDARFVIEHVAFYPSKEVAEGKTAEHELSKRSLYTGPPFDELDEGLQTLFEDYLRERGIDESMAMFIPQYIDQKETQEYMGWIQNIKKFVE